MSKRNSNFCSPKGLKGPIRLEAVATRLEAIATRVESIASRFLVLLVPLDTVKFPLVFLCAELGKVAGGACHAD